MEGSRIEGSGSRAHAVRLQRLIAKVRQTDDLPSSYETRPRGDAPATRSAQNMGVGDNLRAALTDVYTEGNPVAPSFVDGLNREPVLGDGTLEPGTAFAPVRLSISGRLSRPLPDPMGLAKQTSGALAAAGHAATVSHSGLGAGALDGVT